MSDKAEEIAALRAELAEKTRARQEAQDAAAVAADEANKDAQIADLKAQIAYEDAAAQLLAQARGEEVPAPSADEKEDKAGAPAPSTPASALLSSFGTPKADDEEEK